MLTFFLRFSLFLTLFYSGISVFFPSSSQGGGCFGKPTAERDPLLGDHKKTAAAAASLPQQTLTSSGYAAAASLADPLTVKSIGDRMRAEIGKVFGSSGVEEFSSPEGKFLDFTVLGDLNQPRSVCIGVRERDYKLGANKGDILLGLSQEVKANKSLWNPLCLEAEENRGKALQRTVGGLTKFFGPKYLDNTHRDLILPDSPNPRVLNILLALFQELPSDTVACRWTSSLDMLSIGVDTGRHIIYVQLRGPRKPKLSERQSSTLNITATSVIE